MKHKNIITFLSIVIPFIVFLLYFTPKYNDFEINFLPKLNAFINASVFIVLIVALIAIKKRKEVLHKRLIYLAFTLTIVFLVSYIIHHATHESVKFGDDSYVKYIYYFILITHIVLSVIITPLVLITLSRGIKRNFKKHKQIARITLPLWLYVSFTGVLVYMFISPYY